MKVRVFVPNSNGSTGQPVFSGSDHSFPGVPSIGQAVRFTDHREGDFTVVNVGYVQDGDAFISAVWLASSDAPLVYCEEKGAQLTTEYRDLNHDVPPATMTSY